MREVGLRVGAIASISQDKAVFFGYGTYLGEFPYPYEFMGVTGFDNPKIQLDNGDVVWGCECWWSPEDSIKKRLETVKEVTMITVAEYRKKSNG